jgi:hypothetical protein
MTRGQFELKLTHEEKDTLQRFLERYAYLYAGNEEPYEGDEKNLEDILQELRSWAS